MLCTLSWLRMENRVTPGIGFSKNRPCARQRSYLTPGIGFSVTPLLHFELAKDGKPRSIFLCFYQRDQESGLDYALNRYHSNTNGRFTSADKGDAQLYMPVTLNRYTYGANDPITH